MVLLHPYYVRQLVYSCRSTSHEYYNRILYYIWLSYYLSHLSVPEKAVAYDL